MASRQRYQNGSLLKQRRADNRSEWILRYRVTLPDGRRVQRRAVIGTTEKYRTESQAQKAADQVRLTINSLKAGRTGANGGAGREALQRRGTEWIQHRAVVVNEAELQGHAGPVYSAAVGDVSHVGRQGRGC